MFSLVRYSEYVRITFHPQYEKKKSVDYCSQKQKSILRIESIVKHFSYRGTIFYSGVCYRVTVQTKRNKTKQKCSHTRSFFSSLVLHFILFHFILLYFLFYFILYSSMFQSYEIYHYFFSPFFFHLFFSPFFSSNIFFIWIYNPKFEFSWSSFSIVNIKYRNHSQVWH